LEHPGEFEPQHLYHRVGPYELHPADRIFPFVQPRQLLEDPGSTRYALSWAAADPDSFQPRRDVTVERQKAYSPTA
ncbi:MAG: FMN-binding glutamate synthase family protein, partial [Alphaproteobacteria bacterium]